MRWFSKSIIAVALAACGIAAAAALTVAPNALAWDWHSLPSGYGVSSYQLTCHTSTDNCLNGDGSTCDVVTITAPNATPNQTSVQDCSDPNFQAEIDSFVNATICTVNPAADPARCAATTTTSATTTGQTTTDATTTNVSPGGGGTTTTTPTTTTSVPGGPVAAFTTTENGLTVNFHDGSTSPTSTIASISWQFGDGGTAVGSQASHVYTAAGTFVVVEIVTDANGLTGQATTTLDISPFDGDKAFAEQRSPSLSTDATAAYGQPVSVLCVTSWGHVTPEKGREGLTVVGSKQANVAEAMCAALTKPDAQTPLALLVVGHEVAHALGVRPERTADCYSLKRIPALERALHLQDAGSRAKAAAIVEKRWGKSCQTA